MDDTLFGHLEPAHAVGTTGVLTVHPRTNPTSREVQRLREGIRSLVRMLTRVFEQAVVLVDDCPWIVVCVIGFDEYPGGDDRVVIHCGGSEKLYGELRIIDIRVNSIISDSQIVFYSCWNKDE